MHRSNDKNTGNLDNKMCITARMQIYWCIIWASCQIRKIAGAHASGMPGTFSTSPHVSDPDMHHGTCVTHVPWCMPGSLTSGFLWNRRWGGNVPGIPGACATFNFTHLVRGPWCEIIVMSAIAHDIYVMYAGVFRIRWYIPLNNHN